MDANTSTIVVRLPYTSEVFDAPQEYIKHHVLLRLFCYNRTQPYTIRPRSIQFDINVQINFLWWL